MWKLGSFRILTALFLCNIFKIENKIVDLLYIVWYASNR